jgi:hypothetical protein
MAALDKLAPLVGYALNTIAEGGDAGRSFFDHFVADAQAQVAGGVAAGTIKPSRDERARVVDRRTRRRSAWSGRCSFG